MQVQFWQDRKLLRDLVLVLSIGTVLALISPFGATSHLHFPAAWAYWVGLLAWGWFIASFIGPRLERALHALPEILRYFLISLVMTMIMMPAIILVQAMMHDPVAVSYWPQLVFLVWVLSAAITGISWLSHRAFSAPAAPPDGSTFLGRIPARLTSGALLALSSEDHYLRIHTSAGSDLILMRLSDAISELDGYDGMQVHRSWWVARAGVADTNRDGGKITLTLRDDAHTQVPVSRTFAKQVREAGWLG